MSNARFIFISLFTTNKYKSKKFIIRSHDCVNELC